MDMTERNTGKVSPSTETNEVFSANTNNENTIGDEIMMDTTERGMASPCEKMEAEYVEIGQAKKFDRPVVIEDCDTLPQTTDSDEDGKYLMCLFKFFGLTVRTIFTDPEELKRLYNDKTLTESEFYFKSGRLIWHCLKDIGDEIESTDHKNQLDLLSNPKEDSAIFTNSRIKSESFRGVKITPLNNRGQLFVSNFGAFEILSKTKLNSPSVVEFQNELYHNILPSLLWTGKAEISPEYAEKIGTDAPAPAVTQEPGTRLAPVTDTGDELFQSMMDTMQSQQATISGLQQTIAVQQAHHRREMMRKDVEISRYYKSWQTSRGNTQKANARCEALEKKLDECHLTIKEQADARIATDKRVAELENELAERDKENNRLKGINEQLEQQIEVFMCERMRAAEVATRLHMSKFLANLNFQIGDYLDTAYAYGHTIGIYDDTMDKKRIGNSPLYYHKKVVTDFIHYFATHPECLKPSLDDVHKSHIEEGTLSEYVGDKQEGKSVLEGADFIKRLDYIAKPNELFSDVCYY